MIEHGKYPVFAFIYISYSLQKFSFSLILVTTGNSRYKQMVETGSISGENYIPDEVDK